MSMLVYPLYPFGWVHLWLGLTFLAFFSARIDSGNLWCHCEYAYQCCERWSSKWIKAFSLDVEQWQIWNAKKCWAWADRKIPTFSISISNFHFRTLKLKNTKTICCSTKSSISWSKFLEREVDCWLRKCDQNETNTKSKAQSLTDEIPWNNFVILPELDDRWGCDYMPQIPKIKMVSRSVSLYFSA